MNKTPFAILFLLVFWSPASAEVDFETDLAERTFRFFWDTADPQTGLIPDHYPDTRFASVAAVGFGLSAYPIGIERGFISRQQGAARTLKTLRFLWDAPSGPEPKGKTSYQGFFYHFLEPSSGVRYQNSELSTIDTALLMGGVLFVRDYFDGPGQEAEIRELAEKLYRRVDWKWAQQQDTGLMGHGWRPESGPIPHAYRGYNEAMILYILALGSPTHPADSRAWEAFVKTYEWANFEGYEQVNFPPLFGHQYSHLWIDFRDIRDDYMTGRRSDYFENSRQATLSQKAYGERRRFPAGVWGLTACRGPGGGEPFKTYWARGAAFEGIRDDGTIAPTAAGGSIPFAPEECLGALRKMRSLYGDKVYREYGFVDAFNPFYPSDRKPARGQVLEGVWFDDSHLGIDQGPILMMLANYQDDLIWKVMRADLDLRRGLRQAGFRGGWLDR